MGLIKYRLVTYLIVFIFGSSLWAVPTPDSVKSVSGPYQPNYIVVSPAELTSLFDLTYRIQMEPKLNEIFQSEFEDLLEVPKAAQEKYSLPAFSETLTSAQLVAILHSAPKLKDAVSLAMATLSGKKKVSAKEKEVLFDMIQDEIVKVQVDPVLFNNIKDKADPSSPLAIETPDGKPGYYGAETYVNHEHLEDPYNPEKSRVLPGENILEKVIGFIDGATSELLINVYEFNVVEIEDALVRAYKRGVKIYFATDSDNIYSKSTDTEGKKLKKKEHLEIIERLQERTNHEIVFRAVDTTKLNHQKLVVRDADIVDRAAVLISSGNFMYSCLHPRGDGHALPAGVNVEAARPNANHVTIINGQTPAIIARQELRKTILAGAKGSAGYPASGSYLFYNQPKDVQANKNFFLQTFSPNGGMGSINRDITVPVIVEAQGPIYAAQYVFADDHVEKKLTERIEREYKTNGKVEFYSVGDGNFSMQTYSAFFHMSGLSLNPETRLYSDSKDAPMVKMLPPAELAAFRNGIRIAPPHYDDGKWVQLPGDSTKTKFSSILHHKLWLFVGSQISTPGTSFNTSDGAEGNQEQVTVTNDPTIFKKLFSAVRWLYENGLKSVYQEAQDRNKVRAGVEVKTKPTVINPKKDKVSANQCHIFYKKVN